MYITLLSKGENGKKMNSKLKKLTITLTFLIVLSMSISAVAAEEQAALPEQETPLDPPMLEEEDQDNADYTVYEDLDVEEEYEQDIKDENIPIDTADETFEEDREIEEIDIPQENNDELSEPEETEDTPSFNMPIISGMFLTSLLGIGTRRKN